MIGLDTNVLVRFLVEDDEVQTAKAAALIEKAIDENSTLFISDVVLCETVWVLSSCYRFSRPEITTVLRKLLEADHLSFAPMSRHAHALTAYAAGKGDFADYVIREQCVVAGCSVVATFDQALLKESGYQSP
ncbi:MAG: type II toxin-antitoxin system VapC family toxin [Polyangiaceae bacterium]|nr:type II toxin-antitoxin system VapC family toxin [Polyangiaceae bacterium]